MRDSNPRLITACQGSRDFYQLPLALQEVGWLDRHVTDFYAGPRLQRVAQAIGRSASSFLERRSAPGLPASQVVSSPMAALQRQFDPRQEGHPTRVTFEVERALSVKLGKMARQTECDLFAYSQSAYWAFRELSDRKRLLFQFHPHLKYEADILQRDGQLTAESSARIPEEWTEEWRMADQILCASSFTKASLVAQGCSPQKITVAPYGNDRLTFPRRVAFKGAVCKFLFVGQGIQRKGLHHLLRAWKACSIVDAELVIVCSNIDDEISALVGGDNVSLVRRLPLGELTNLMLSSDVFVMPSLCEGFGLVFGEALSAGLFCIGTRNTGLADIAPPEWAGSVIGAGDVDELKIALESAAERWRRSTLRPDAIQEFSRFRTWLSFRKDVRIFISKAYGLPPEAAK